MYLKVTAILEVDCTTRTRQKSTLSETVTSSRKSKNLHFQGQKRQPSKVIKLLPEHANATHTIGWFF